MTFKQIRLVFDDGKCTLYDGEQPYLITTEEASEIQKKVYGTDGNYILLKEEEYLNEFAAEGWVLHTANYSVLGKQECHYFLFVKE